jgi:hypothetical protein
MIKVENHCVECDLPCINCGRKHVEVRVCDECGEYADYITSSGDFCEECLTKMLDLLGFNTDSRDIDELCELIGMEVEKI